VNCLLIHIQTFSRVYFSGDNVSSSHVILNSIYTIKKKKSAHFHCDKYFSSRTTLTRAVAVTELFLGTNTGE